MFDLAEAATKLSPSQLLKHLLRHVFKRIQDVVGRAMWFLIEFRVQPNCVQAQCLNNDRNMFETKFYRQNGVTDHGIIQGFHEKVTSSWYLSVTSMMFMRNLFSRLSGQIIK